jgi:hypothetical protein
MIDTVGLSYWKYYLFCIANFIVRTYYWNVLEVQFFLVMIKEAQKGVFATRVLCNTEGCLFKRSFVCNISLFTQALNIQSMTFREWWLNIAIGIILDSAGGLALPWLNSYLEIKYKRKLFVLEIVFPIKAILDLPILSWKWYYNNLRCANLLMKMT